MCKERVLSSLSITGPWRYLGMMSSLQTMVVTTALVFGELARLADRLAGVANPIARTGMRGPNSFCTAKTASKYSENRTESRQVGGEWGEGHWPADKQPILCMVYENADRSYNMWMGVSGFQEEWSHLQLECSDGGRGPTQRVAREDDLHI